jgi:hypothetical protein
MTHEHQNEMLQQGSPLQGRYRQTRTLKKLRGTGVIYDVIDEWLAPAFARRIAEQQARPENDELRK